MMVTVEQVDRWLGANEDENLEFKEAKNNFHFDKLVKYCGALANEGGGSIVLGVTDRRPRRVVGTSAFPNLDRSGQGLDLMYRECVQHSKPLPDYSRSSDHSVWVTLHGEIQDPEFMRFLEQVGAERMASFSAEDLLVVDLVHRGQVIPVSLAPRIEYLLQQGIIEREGRGRGTRYLLSRRFYRFLGSPGAYTRRRGLDRETNKALLLRHIQECGVGGAVLRELQQVLPDLSRAQVQTLLRELKRDEWVEVRGVTKSARWFLAQHEPGGGAQ